LDEQALYALAQWQIESGIDWLVACGTTAETPTLSDDEWLQVLRIVTESAAGRVPVWAGCTHNATRQAVERAKIAARVPGVTAILSASPYYNKPTQEGQFEHFKAVRAHCRTVDFQLCVQLWIWGPDWFSSEAEALASARSDAERNPAPQPQYAFGRQVDACIAHDTFDRLQTLRTPTLITAGELDIFTPLALSEAMHKAIAGSDLVVFPRCGHTHHWEQLERFNSLTTRFMLQH